MKIIILEDDPGIGRILMTILTRSGHDVTLYNDSAELPEKLEGPPDFCIFDNDAPQKDAGINALKKIREEHPNLSLVLVSGGDGARQKAHEAGIDFIAKPFDISKIEDAIKRLRKIPA